MSNDLEQLFANTILKESKEKIESIIKDEIVNLKDDINSQIKDIKTKLSKKVSNLESLVNNEPIVVNMGSVKQPKNEVVHEKFNEIINILQSSNRINKNIMLVGPAGSGKNTLCEQVAKTLSMNYHPLSVGAMTTKSDLIGFINATGNYITTPIREAFENGGLCNIDEIDCGNANTLTILNALLANNQYSFPDKTVQKHKDFVCICNANTYGKGASVEYVGRNRLDSATLDRFIVVEVGYDEKLEQKLVKNKPLLTIIKKIRNNIEESGLKTIVSPRASMQIADLLDSCSFDIEQALEMCIFKGCDVDIKNKLLKGVNLSKIKNSTNNTNKNIKKEPKKDLCISINADNGEFIVTGLEDELCIARTSDWDGAFTINLSSVGDWFSDITERELYLNNGTQVLNLTSISMQNRVSHLIECIKNDYSTIRNKTYSIKFIITEDSKTYTYEVE